MRRSIVVAFLLAGVLTLRPDSAWSQTPCPLSGIVKMNFDGVVVSAASSVDAVAYLASYGVSFTPITPSTQALIYNVTGQAGIASSVPNVLFVTPPGTAPVSYTLGFCGPLRGISFTRGGINSPFVSAAWAVRALDANGVEVASVGEPDRTGDSLPRRFTLSGENIRTFRFDANNAAFDFNHPPFDDFALDAGVTDNQSGSHVFAQFVDGRFPDGTFYRSTLLVSSDNSSSTDCTATLGGLTIPGFGNGSTQSFSVAAGRSSIITTPGTQNLVSGYAKLICTAPVAAQVLYGSYSATGVLLGQSTVFSSPSATIAQLLADQRNGAHLGIAIANTATASTQFVIKAIDENNVEVGTGTVQLAGQAQTAKFLEELITVPSAFVGKVQISTNPSTVGTVFAIGLQFTGPVFTTIPPTVRTTTP